MKAIEQYFHLVLFVSQHFTKQTTFGSERVKSCVYALVKRITVLHINFLVASTSTGQSNATTVGGRVDKLHVGFPTIVNSTSHGNF